MADQNIDFFDHVNENHRPPLLNKGVFIDESFANYKKQISFDKRLSKLLNINLNENILMARDEFFSKLDHSNKSICGFMIKTDKCVELK